MSLLEGGWFVLPEQNINIKSIPIQNELKWFRPCLVFFPAL